MREETFVQTVRRTYRCDLCGGRTEQPVGIEWNIVLQDWGGSLPVIRIEDPLKANKHLCPNCIADIAAIAATLKDHP